MFNDKCFYKNNEYSFFHFQNASDLMQEDNLYYYVTGIIEDKEGTGKVEQKLYVPLGSYILRRNNKFMMLLESEFKERAFVL